MTIGKGKLAVGIGGLLVIAGLQARGALGGGAVAADGESFDGEYPVILQGQLATHDPAVMTVERHHGFIGVGMCTGTLVAPTLVLTAKHCTGTGRSNVVLGEGSQAPRIEVIRTHVPADGADIAVLELKSAPPGIEPVRVSFDAQKIEAIEEVRIVGAGRTGTNGDHGVKRTTSARVRVNRDRLVTRSAGVVCYGDSGGPSFAMIDGHEELVAVSSKIDARRCERAHGHLVRTDRHAAWLGSLISPSKETPSDRTPSVTPPRAQPRPPARPEPPPAPSTVATVTPPPEPTPNAPPRLPPQRAANSEGTAHAEAESRAGHTGARAQASGGNATAYASGGTATAHATGGTAHAESQSW